MMRKRTIFQKILNRMCNSTHKVNKVNWYKTLVFNLSFLPIHQALKFPVLIYGKCKFGALYGTLTFLDDVIKKGMFKIGVSDPFRSIDDMSYISISGVLIVGRHVTLRRGIRINVCGKLRLENNVYIGDNNYMMVANEITIKQATRFGNNTSTFDTDFHYMLNTQSGIVHKNTSPIVIGENNWIGPYCVIKKGAETPQGTIVAGPYAMVSKNYTNLIPEYSIIAGSPAKLIKENMRRINNWQTDKVITQHFKNTDIDYVFDVNVDLDHICMPTAEIIDNDLHY